VDWQDMRRKDKELTMKTNRRLLLVVLLGALFAQEAH
jgi:hypothetical protein